MKLDLKPVHLLDTQTCFVDSQLDIQTCSTESRLDTQTCSTESRLATQTCSPLNKLTQTYSQTNLNNYDVTTFLPPHCPPKLSRVHLAILKLDTQRKDFC